MKTIRQMNRLFIFVLSMITSHFTFAELNIVSDYGGNSMGSFYDMLDPQDEYGEMIQKELTPDNLKIDEGMYLPVHSELLSPGRFDSYAIDYPTLQSFIIIGYDSLSIEWLKVRKDDLETIAGLVGVVVNIDDVGELNTLKSLTQISLYAMPGDELAERFQITHYPALITRQSVEQ